MENRKIVKIKRAQNFVTTNSSINMKQDEEKKALENNKMLKEILEKKKKELY